MLNTMIHIMRKASLASSREEALDLVLGWVSENLAVDAVVLYLRAPDSGTLDPAAIRGLERAPAAGPARHVAEKREPIRLNRRRPRLRQGRGHMRHSESSFNAYLAVPIVSLRKVLGVLEVQRRSDQSFSDDDTALLLTLSAQLAGLIAETVPVAGPSPKGQKLFLGTPAAPGVAIGTVVLPSSPSPLEAVPDRPARDPAAEIEEFENAVRAVQAELSAGSAEMTNRLPEEIHALYGVYEMILDDPDFISKVTGSIRSGQWAPAALRNTVRALARRFDAMDDEYLRTRAEDVRALGRRLLLHLQYDRPAPGEFPERTVLLGKGVGLTCITGIPAERLAGLVSTRGSVLAHGVIVARALGIPAVVGLEDLPLERYAASEIIVDGYRGQVILNPTPPVRSRFQRLQDEEAELDSDLRSLRDAPAQTPDGRRIALEANIALLNEIASAKERGAEGVGLYRSELPFLLRDAFPGEDLQYHVYRELLEAFAPRPVTMRTLDAGGDKTLPYLPLAELNPALGLRGVRLSLEHPEIFLTQLRALLRANAGVGNLRLLLPMVTLPAELRETRLLIEQARASLLQDGQAAEAPPVGIMLEVPAAVFRIEELAAAADFVSIGTNDLTQYVLAADRGNVHVEAMCDALAPAVLAALALATKGARKQGVPVSVCGEMAGDPLGALLLLGLGVDALSMASGSIPRIKRVIRTFTRVQAQVLWERALRQESARQVRKMLVEAMERGGLGSLVRPGK